MQNSCRKFVKNNNIPKILMCNYYGMCDSNFNVMGHTCKVTKEYYKLLSSKHKVSIAASPCIAQALKKDGLAVEKQLKYNIYVDVPFTLRKRIADKIKLLKNLWDCFHEKEGESLFFYQVDFFFFFYVALFYHRHDKKLFCLIYHQDFTGGKAEKLLQWFYHRALKKIDGVLYTQLGHAVNHDNACWMPDYFYEEKIYLKYAKMKKNEKAVCLGTMNRYKLLEELVSVFSENGYPLEIIGRFDDQERYERLKQYAAHNILIENRVLSENEYYEMLGGARYSILPYDMSQYHNRTSGVLLESLFVGSAPIAPEELLKQNGLPGIGYKKIRELADFALDTVDLGRIEEERRKILIEFRREKVGTAFEDIICNS